MLQELYDEEQRCSTDALFGIRVTSSGDKMGKNFVNLRTGEKNVW